MKARAIARLCLVLIAIFGAVELALSTRFGPGVGGDATIYINTAQNLLAGKGLGLIGPLGEFRLLPYFPPFFSLALAGLGLFHIDLTAAARWLNILMFSGLIYLSGATIQRVARSTGLSIILAFLIAVSPVLIPVYSWAMSEPVSILAGFASLVLILDLLQDPNSKKSLYLAGLLAGISFLTRYSSAAFLGVGVLGIFLLMQVEWKKRFARAAAYLVTGVLPMLVWVIYDVSRTATLASRSLETGVGIADKLSSFWQSMHDIFLLWVVPDSWSINPPYPSQLNNLIVVVLLLGLAGWFFLVLWKSFGFLNKTYRDERFRLVILLILFVLIYITIILVVYITTYPPITIASRMLSPVYVAVLWMVVTLAGLTVGFWNENRRLRTFLSLALLFGVVWYSSRSGRIVQQYYQTGLGYTAPAWTTSTTISAVKDLPVNTLIITNETNAILYLTGRPSYPIKEIFQDKPLSVFTRYGDGNLTGDQSQTLFRDNGAALVLFDTIDDQMVGYYGERTNQRLAAMVNGLRREFRGPDGGIFYYK